MVAVVSLSQTQYRHESCQSGVRPCAVVKCLGERRLDKSGAGDCGKGLSNASAHDSPADEDYDILSKLSASSLHQMMHIHELDTRRFGGGGRQTEASLRAAIRFNVQKSPR
jgi:hypothetical protein